MEQKKPELFNFTCYRKFMSEYYLWHKRNMDGFSYRAMAKQLGFSSPNFLKLVIDGNRNIGHESLEKITNGIGLTKLESEYFSYLVFFGQAKHTVEKNYYYGLLAALRSNTLISKVSPEQSEYFDKWYHPAIREMIVGKKEKLDFQALATILPGKIGVIQVKKSVALLLRLGLVRVNADKKYEHSSPILNTENELKTIAVRHYHKEVLSVAQEMIDVIEPAQREISHLTLSLSEEGFQKLKKRLQDFREEILHMVSEDCGVNGVYHMNFQFYPIAKRGEDENSI